MRRFLIWCAKSHYLCRLWICHNCWATPRHAPMARFSGRSSGASSFSRLRCRRQHSRCTICRCFWSLRRGWHRHNRWNLATSKYRCPCFLHSWLVGSCRWRWHLVLVRVLRSVSPSCRLPIPNPWAGLRGKALPCSNLRSILFLKPWLLLSPCWWRKDVPCLWLPRSRLLLPDILCAPCRWTRQGRWVGCLHT